MDGMITVGMLEGWRATADECFAALERGQQVSPVVSGALAQAVLVMTNEALVARDMPLSPQEANQLMMGGEPDDA